MFNKRPLGLALIISVLICCCIVPTNVNAVSIKAAASKSNMVFPVVNPDPTPTGKIFFDKYTYNSKSILLTFPEGSDRFFMSGTKESFAAVLSKKGIEGLKTKAAADCKKYNIIYFNTIGKISPYVDMIKDNKVYKNTGRKTVIEITVINKKPVIVSKIK